jgi:hypothetical protein
LSEITKRGKLTNTFFTLLRTILAFVFIYYRCKCVATKHVTLQMYSHVFHVFRCTGCFASDLPFSEIWEAMLSRKC